MLTHLRNYLSKQNNKAAKKSSATREDLVKAAQDHYASASKAGGSNYATVTSNIASYTAAAKSSTFDTWSDSELKNYLDSYGVKNYQGSTSNELRALARENAQYFQYGTNAPGGSIFSSIQGGFQWVVNQFKIGAASGRDQAQAGADKAKDAGAKASDKAKKEL